jgi:hypothetical protein
MGDFVEYWYKTQMSFLFCEDLKFYPNSLFLEQFRSDYARNRLTH